jgi:hypothetical protein
MPSVICLSKVMRRASPPRLGTTNGRHDHQLVTRRRAALERDAAAIGGPLRQPVVDAYRTIPRRFRLDSRFRDSRQDVHAGRDKYGTHGLPLTPP